MGDNGGMETLDESWVTRSLEQLVAGRVDGVRPLAGGASRMSFTASVAGERCVVQVERGDTGRDMLEEFALLRYLHDQGLPVARPIAAGRIDGRAVMVTEHVAGETLGRRVVRGLTSDASESDGQGSARRRAFVGQFAAAAAAIHRVDPAIVTGATSMPEGQLAGYSTARAALAPDRPVLALAERWLVDNPPAIHPAVICHGDLRVGNLVVDGGELKAVLDWELAHVGHPAEDLGWACVRAWRFGGSGPALGCSTREELLEAYEAAGGARIDPQTLVHHEVLGTWKWALMCLMQADAHLSGVAEDLELLAIGRRVVENEFDLLRLMGWEMDDSPWPSDIEDASAGDAGPRTSESGMGEGDTGLIPERIHLETALARDREAGSTPSDYRRRLHRSVSEMVDRERDGARRLEHGRRALVERLGVSDHRDLADQIVDGRRRPDRQLLDELGREVIRQLEIVNPGYAGREDDAPPVPPGEVSATG